MENKKTPSSIRMACKEHLGKEPSKWIRITTGLFNETFILKFPKDIFIQGRDEKPLDEFIIRIAPADDVGLIFYEKHMMWQEPDIHKILLEKTSIPVPEIFIADFSREIMDRDFLIMEKLDGTPLNQVYSSLDRNKILSVYNQVGDFISQAHEITYEEYGYRGSHHPCQTATSWPKAFKIMWNCLLDDLVDCEAYSEREANEFREVLGKHSSSFNQDFRASLLHMDVWSQNILINKKGDVTGLVDWDRSLSGDPEIEFSVLEYCGLTNESFWMGYGEKPPLDDEDYKIRMKFYFLYEHQKYIVINSTRRKNKVKAESFKNDAKRILRRLR